MFGLFNAPDCQHPVLGTFVWQRGRWRGGIVIPQQHRVPLILAGSRKGPAPDALTLALALPADFSAIAEPLCQALFEHYQAYCAAAPSDPPHAADAELPVLHHPEEALGYARLSAVVIEPLGQQLTAELCYRVPWDEEHILGARFRGRQWVELCGSTLVP